MRGLQSHKSLILRTVAEQGVGAAMIADERNSEVDTCATLSPETIDKLLPLVYDQLRLIARHERRRIRVGDTLATTALVNEVYAQLVHHPAFKSHGDFLRIAAVAMRRELVDYIRGKMCAKRGSGVSDLPLDDSDMIEFVVEDEDMVLRVHEALQSLSALNPRLVAVVECRFFGGFNEAETAEALGISERTVQREWVIARAWLKKELES